MNLKRYSFLDLSLIIVVGFIFALAPAAWSQSVSVNVAGDVPNNFWSGDAFTANTSVCPSLAGDSIELAQGDEYVSRRYDVPPAFVGNGSNVTIPFSSYLHTSSSSRAKMHLLQYNDNDDLFDRNIHDVSPHPMDEWILWDTTSNPAPSRVLQADTTSFEIKLKTRFGDTCFDLIGDVRFTNPNVDCNAVDCTDPNATPTSNPTTQDNTELLEAIAAGNYGNPLEWVIGSSDSDDLDFDDAVDAFEAFTCGDPLDFIVSKAGGGGLLKKILGYITSIAKSQLGIQEGSMALNCKADALNELQTDSLETQQDIYEGQTQVQNLPPNAPFNNNTWNIDNGTGRTASDAAADALDNLDSGIENDNVITAAARTNRLLVANVRMQAQLSDRLMGPSDRSPYQEEDGPLLSPSEVDAENGADFAEGDYTGTRDKIAGYGAGITPDYDEMVETEDADAEFMGTGSCMASQSSAPTGTGTELAFSTMKWNASQRLASSNMGNFICSVIDQPPRSTTSICFGSSEGFSTSAMGGSSSLSNGNFCVYGPDAPAFSNNMFNALPFILLMFAALSVFKMFFN